MKLVFLGPPGVGKGTHAKILSEKYHVPHLATGDILRQHIRDKTALGRRAKDVIERGELVPDELVNEMMVEKIKTLGSSRGFILDGYPRTIGQAEALDHFLIEANGKLDAVLNFTASGEVIINRLSGRWVCPDCGSNFHIRNIPPKQEGICDHCGGRLIQRKDDRPETIRHRLAMYEKETKPLVNYYAAKGCLHEVLGEHEVSELQEALKTLFDKLQLKL